MMVSYIIGITGMVILIVGWIAIQTIWRRVFSEQITDEDVLAERTSCGNCGCTKACRNKTNIVVE